ncbi:MAG: glycosyltransferase family 2 protein [Actinobacteria bacterium]|nr:glycosyltransferase family 2 protein [Actinomycetota bacterium]
MTSPIRTGETAHSNFPAVSVILPVLNEAMHLKQSIATILSQSYQGEIEVIMAIGPSHDGTIEIAQDISRQDSRVLLIDSPTGRTPNGLNLAIAKARHEIIVRIDGHSEIDKTYIADAVETLEKTGAVNVGGIMAAEGVTNFQKATACAMRSIIGVGPSKFHTGGKSGPADTVYLGVFKKSALLQIGGFDERFTRAQDWEMNYRLRKAGGAIWFDPRLIVTYRPRSNIQKLARQYFEYGRWRRAIARSYPETVSVRYLAAPVALLINLFSIIFGVFLHEIFLIPVLGYIALITFGGLLVGKSWQERIRLPFILMAMHMSWGWGFISSPRKLMS